MRVKQRHEGVLPREPFVAWIQERSKRYETFEQFAAACGRSSRWFRAIVNGYQNTQGKLYPVDHVKLDIVDEILLREGSTFLWELYPVEETDALD